ncbi:hypothetical protein IC757_03990 [Wenzhouxiangella sp. AB-CW3]|uniref:hypothetical protein n=1 Tax=Wenzhouxiangella sp. AB-CW3 TaxID=2771012 RepID=UPI00168BA218|nr:hypothetical protein [Wenzhouxiangella sp. AB-CW3]QOC23317.1 hypothetical protein IC757_03990 [Wenzhouxiangella sp. AB-CW3]
MNLRNPAVPGLIQDPEWRLPRHTPLVGRNKAEVETEAALVLVVYVVVLVFADVETWSANWKEMMFWSATMTYFFAVLSPERTFGGDAEIVLQLLLGTLLAAALMLLFTFPLWTLLFSPGPGCAIAVIGNAVQRRMWDHM